MTTRQVRVSDLSGEEGAIETTFGYAGQSLTVDLTPAEISEFDRIINPYIAVARKIVTTVPSTRKAPLTTAKERAIIRLWARDRGMRCASKGKIAADVYEAYLSRGPLA